MIYPYDEYKVVRVSHMLLNTELQDCLNDDWEIVRVDSTDTIIIYVLKKWIIPDEPEE